MSFKRYLEYKDSGVAWFGEIPASWETPSLYMRYSCELGKMLDSAKIRGTHLIPYVRNVDVQWGAINLEDLPQMDIREDEYQRYAVEQGDLLVCEGGEVGRAAIVPTLREAVGFQKALHRLRALSDDEDPTFMYFTLLWAAQTGVFDLNGSSTIAHLTGEQLRKFRFPKPPIEEQVSIVAYLKRKLAKLDALVAEQQKLIALLKEKRQAVISQAVTKGLDPTVPMKNSGVEWLGEMPAHWKTVPLKFVASVQTGVAKGKDNIGKQTVRVPYLRVANVQDGYLALDDMASIEIAASELPRYLLRCGDVLMNEGGDFDKLGRGHIWRAEIEPCIHQNHVFAVRPHGVSPEWLNTITGSGYAQFFFMTRSKQSTNLASISSSNLMELPITLPPETEQVEILEFLGRQAVKLEELSQQAQRTVSLLQERRAALISAAVTGKIDVRATIAPTEAVA